MTRPTKNLPIDGSNERMQTCAQFVTADATASAKTSPLAYSSSVITITVPVNAVEWIVYPTTDMRISEVVGMAQYDVVAAGTKEVIPCVGATYLYIIRDASDGSLRFRFHTI